MSEADVSQPPSSSQSESRRLCVSDCDWSTTHTGMTAVSAGQNCAVSAGSRMLLLQIYSTFSVFPFSSSVGGSNHSTFDILQIPREVKC